MIGPLPQFGHLRLKPFQTAGHRGRSGACVCISLMETLAVDRGKMGETRAELKTTGCPCVGMSQSWRKKYPAVRRKRRPAAFIGMNRMQMTGSQCKRQTCRKGRSRMKNAVLMTRMTAAILVDRKS